MHMKLTNILLILIIFVSRYRLYSPKMAHSGSYQRVNLVTASLSVTPSFSSAYSIENLEKLIDRQPHLHYPQSEYLRRRVLIPDSNTYYTSCQEFGEDDSDPFDDPNYTDTVKSNDSTGSMLRRSISVPPEYTFKSAAYKHARDVFEEPVGISDNLNQNSNKEQEVSSEDGKKWRQTMADLLENPEYQDSFQSSSSGAALLARVKATQIQDGNIDTELVTPDKRSQETHHFKYVKNLIIMAISFLFIFGSYLSVRNLQSSILKDTTLAFYSLSVVYASLFLGCLFATSIVQRLRPKPSMVLCMFGLCCYIGANFYPHYYTLLPGSFAAGSSMAILWTAQATYLTNISVCYAEATGKKLQNVVSKFNGIFFMFFSVSQIMGGVISSTVLMAQPSQNGVKIFGQMDMSSSNFTDYLVASNYSYSDIVAEEGHDPMVVLDIPDINCGVSYCASHGTPSNGKNVVEQNILYMLLGIYAGLSFIGILICLILLDPLEGAMASSDASLMQQMTAVFKWFIDLRVLCIAWASVFSLQQITFMFGEFNKVSW